MTTALILTLLFISLSVTGWVINNVFSSEGLELLGIFMCIIFGIAAFLAGVVPMDGETIDISPSRVTKLLDGTLVYSNEINGDKGFLYDATVKIWTAKEEDIVVKKTIKKSGFGFKENTYGVGLKKEIEKPIEDKATVNSILKKELNHDL
jgi:hypothetical protein